MILDPGPIERREGAPGRYGRGARRGPPVPCAARPRPRQSIG